MNKDFDNINDLIEEVKQDKVAQGANSSMLNRYPVRFVLFDNFSDSKSFVSELIELGVTKMQKIIDWMDKNNPDQMLTYTNLTERIKDYIETNNDFRKRLSPLLQSRFNNFTKNSLFKRIRFFS